jgi:4-coumarate--CoA ligase
VIQAIVSTGYGLTETSPTTHLLPPSHAVLKVGSAGILLPNLEARLVVDNDGKEDVDASEGEPGELWVRGSTIMKVIYSIIVTTPFMLTVCQ